MEPHQHHLSRSWNTSFLFTIHRILSSMVFIFFSILTGLQILVTFLIKGYSSRKFSMKEDYLNKFIHLLLSLNIASPFEDWDQGKFSVEEYRQRHRQTNIEMALSISVTIIFSMIMLIPLYYTGQLARN